LTLSLILTIIACCNLRISLLDTLYAVHASSAEVSQAISKDADRAGSYVREQQDQEQ
jgi:hypothetical protein